MRTEWGSIRITPGLGLLDSHPGDGQLIRVLDKLPVAAYTCDPDGLITFFNQSAVRLWGREPKLNDPVDRFCGSFKLFATDGTPIRHDRCWMALTLSTGKELYGREIVIECPDGHRVTALAHANPIFDNDGRLVGAVNVLIDVTDRKRAERYRILQLEITRILADSEDMPRAARRILETTCVGSEWDAGCLWILDPDGAALRCLEIWRRRGISIPAFESACRARRFTSGVGLPGRIWATRQPAWIADLSQDGNFPRAAMAARDGLRAAFGYPILLGDHVLGVLEFFSQRVREPDEDLVSMMSGLGSQIGQFMERKVAERAVREANRRKDEFLATLAHELRNPLAPILYAGEILSLLGSEDPKARWSVRVIQRQSAHLMRLVDDLLDASRITSDKLELLKQSVDLASIVDAAVDSTRPLIEDRRQRLTVKLPAAPVVLTADAVRLSQVLANLLNNAAKFTPCGGHIALEALHAEGGVVLRVMDSGEGIPPEKLDQIFEMFTQLDGSIARTRGGLGIGLTLVKRLVEMHGGTVSARSDGAGKGSTFEVRLPVTR